MRRLFWLLVGLLCLGVWPLLAQSPDSAHWRLGHFALDVPEVDVYLDNTLMLQGIKLAALSAWRDLPSGAHTLSIVAANGTLDRPLLQPFTLNIQANEWVTMALAGRRVDGSLKLHAVIEDMRPISPSLTRLSVFNAFPNNPPLTIRLDNTEIIRRLAYPGTLPEGNDGMESRDILAGSYDLTIELADGRLVKETSVGLGAGRAYLLVVFGTLDRPFPILVATEITASGTPGIPSAQGTIPIIIPTATAPANTPVVVIPTATSTTAAPETTTAIESTTAPESTEASTTEASEATEAATQSAEPTVTLALPLQSASGQARVRFGHFSPGISAFTLYLDSQIVAALSNQGTIITEYIEQSAGTHTLALVLEGETLDQAFLRQEVSFVAGGTYMVAAIGSLDIGSFGIMNVAETISSDPSEAQIGFFNAIPDTREIAILDEGNPILRKLAFPLAYVEAGDGYASVSVQPGRYSFEVVEDNNNIFTPLSMLPDLRLGAGRYYTVVITGLKDQLGQPYLIFTSYPPSVAVTQEPTATPTAVGQ